MPYTRLFSLLHCYFIVSLFIHCIWHNVVQMVTLLTLIDLSVGSRSVWDELKSDETIWVNNYFYYYLRTQQESRKQNYQSDSFGAFLWHSKKSVSNQPSFSQVRSPLGLPDINVLLLFFLHVAAFGSLIRKYRAVLCLARKVAHFKIESPKYFS